MHLRGNGSKWLLMTGGLLLAGCGSGSSPEGTKAATADVAPQQAAAPAITPFSVPPAGPPQVVLRTSAGPITIELDPKASPLTVENFLQYVERGHYDKTIFHQVVDGYVLVGGSYDPKLQEKPVSNTIRNEAHNGLSNVRGTIAMARSADTIDSSTCQFFINLSDNAEQLDHKGDEPDKYGYCVFGKIVEGLEVCDQIAKSAVHNQDAFQMLPVSTVMIESAKRLK
jgi:cyclophilin family peptidyl-prolyl cis-trans isomerase